MGVFQSSLGFRSGWAKRGASAQGRGGPLCSRVPPPSAGPPVRAPHACPPARPRAMRAGAEEGLAEETAI